MIRRKGKVWRSIVEHLDQSDAQNEFISVTDVPGRRLPGIRGVWAEVEQPNLRDLSKKLANLFLSDVVSLYWICLYNQSG